MDVSDRAPHGPARDHAANAGDRHERKQQDFDDLVDHALERSGSKKALVPSKSKKKMQQIDLNKLTRSKRQLVIEQALEACSLTGCVVIACCRFIEPLLLLDTRSCFPAVVCYHAFTIAWL